MPDKTYDDSDTPMMNLNNTLDLIDEDSDKEFDYIERLEGLDWRAITGKKHRHLVESLLYEHRTLEDIAELEGVPLKVVRLRLHFVCERLKEFEDKRQEYFDLKTRRPDITFEEFLEHKKKLSKIPRKSILLKKDDEE